jgi:hypothetical protein
MLHVIDIELFYYYYKVKYKYESKYESKYEYNIYR